MIISSPARAFSALKKIRQQEQAIISWPHNLHLSRLRAVKKNSGEHILNKAGRVVLRGYDDLHGPVKLYEAANEEHAVFIESVSRHRDLLHALPATHARQSCFIAAAWAEGKTLADSLRKGSREDLLSRLCRLQADIHTVRAADLPPPGFDYWQDLIRPRFVRAGALANKAGITSKAIDIFESAAIQDSKRLLHPDLTPVNIVIDNNDNFVVIDNELVTIGALPLIDVLNTAYSLRARLGLGAARAYIKSYLTLTDKNDLYREQKPALESFWAARMIGSAFVAGKTARMISFFDAYENGKILPDA